MAGFFGSRRDTGLSERARLTARYATSRWNLLAVVIFTVVNIVFTTLGSMTYFLFSATIPYFVASFGSTMCGLMPDSFYEEIEMTEAELLPTSAIALFLGIALVLLSVYFLCWLFSKKHVGWMIAALVCFAVDTVAMLFLYGISVDMLLDAVFHAWVIYYLISGIVAYYKLKALPEAAPIGSDGAAFPEGDALAEDGVSGLAGEERLPESPVLRRADTDVKSRVFVESEAFGHTVTYRRVGRRTDELVIDGDVYASVEVHAGIEIAHALSAVCDGHSIEVGFDGVSRSYIKVDGEIFASKIRLV